MKGHKTNLKLLSLSKKLQFDLFFLAAFAAEPADAEISLGAALSLAHCYSEISDFSSRRAEFGRLAVLGWTENLPEPLDGVTV